jgi:hypothetical protein
MFALVVKKIVFISQKPPSSKIKEHFMFIKQYIEGIAQF